MKTVREVRTRKVTPRTLPTLCVALIKRNMKRRRIGCWVGARYSLIALSICLVFAGTQTVLNLLHKTHFCTVSQAEREIDNLCREILSGSHLIRESKFCDSICVKAQPGDDGSASLINPSLEISRCLGMHYAKQIVFQARLRVAHNQTKEIFVKTPSSTWDNITVKMLNGLESDVNESMRGRFKEFLLQHHFRDHNIFPKPVGICRDYFASEQAVPLNFPSITEFSSHERTWIERLNIAVGLVHLVQRLDDANLLFCDVKYEHIGLERDSTNLVILDADHVYFKSQLGEILSQGKTCSTDYDCVQVHCYATCNTETNTCMNMTKENLQTICDIIFLGNHSRDIIRTPGLLESSFASKELLSTAQDCANFGNSSMQLQEIRIKLLKELTKNVADHNALQEP